MAAPSKYTPELWDEILTRLSRGEPLAQICRDEHMPSTFAVYVWRDRDEAHTSAFARARDEGFDAIALDALRIADTPVEGIIERATALGTEVTRQDALGHRRLQVETRLKLLAKWDPKRYGDRQAVDLTNSDGSLRPSDTEAAARMAAIMAAAAARRGEADGSDLA